MKGRKNERISTGSFVVKFYWRICTELNVQIDIKLYFTFI